MPKYNSFNEFVDIYAMRDCIGGLSIIVYCRMLCGVSSIGNTLNILFSAIWYSYVIVVAFLMTASYE